MNHPPEGRRLLRLEVRNAETPIERKPEWIKTKARMGPEYTALQHLVKLPENRGLWMTYARYLTADGKPTVTG